MKGFLRRSLENARGAEQRLKPLTGSVYAGNYRRQELQAGSWGEEITNVPSASSAEPTSRQITQPGIAQTAPAVAETLLSMTPDPREAAAGGFGNKSERQQPSSAIDSPVDLFVATSHRESAIRPAPRSDVFETPLPLLSPRPSSGPPGPSNLPLLSSSQRNEGSRAEASVSRAVHEISRAGATAPQVAQRIFEAEKNSQEPRPAPLLPQQKIETQKAETRTVEPLLRSAVTAMPPRAAPQVPIPRNLPAQEPEIQVHIGRIEVIAAAPQPPRVPSPRPNRATSLADYLAGRNGRP